MDPGAHRILQYAPDAECMCSVVLHWDVRGSGIKRAAGQHLQVEDEPGGRALADDVDKEVGDGKEPDIGAGQHVLHEGLHHRRFLHWLCADTALMSGLAHSRRMCADTASNRLLRTCRLVFRRLAGGYRGMSKVLWAVPHEEQDHGSKHDAHDAGGIHAVPA